MNIISWNVRGAARTDFKRTFREMVNSYKPDMVILTETRLSGDRANIVLSNLGFDNYLMVDAMQWCSQEVYGSYGILKECM